MRWLCAWLHLACLPGVIAGPAIAVDGDTLMIGTQAIRLAGIDAEELREPNGPRVAFALAALLAGRTVLCHPTGTSYHRVVATCFADNQDIGAGMVRLGAALDCAHYSNGKYRSLEPAGARARLLQKGYCR